MEFPIFQRANGCVSNVHGHQTKTSSGVLCPHANGALKLTEEGEWAHMACAYWIEETGFSNLHIHGADNGNKEISIRPE